MNARHPGIISFALTLLAPFASPANNSNIAAHTTLALIGGPSDHRHYTLVQ
jgi:hypothetical protein